VAKIVSTGSRKKIISEEQREIYIYGFELVICSIISLVIVILIASITGMYYECAIYYVVFSITRLFSGGFHADTYLRCKISYIGCLLITLGLFKMMNILQPLYWLMLFIFSSLIIVHFAPVENENKPLSETEKKSEKYNTNSYNIKACNFRNIIFDRKQYLSDDTFNFAIYSGADGIRRDKGKEEKAMKENLKKATLKAVAKISLVTAQKAAGAASWWDMYQPKEPNGLKS